VGLVAVAPAGGTRTQTITQALLESLGKASLVERDSPPLIRQEVEVVRQLQQPTRHLTPLQVQVGQVRPHTFWVVQARLSWLVEVAAGTTTQQQEQVVLAVEELVHIVTPQLQEHKTLVVVAAVRVVQAALVTAREVTAVLAWSSCRTAHSWTWQTLRRVAVLEKLLV
jgi:hypothetical protein